KNLGVQSMHIRSASIGAFSLALAAASCSQGQYAGTRRQQMTGEKTAQVAASVTTNPSDELNRATAGVSPDVQRAKASLKRADEKAKAQGVTAASTAVHAQVRLAKDHLFDRTFLYGFDLQYSSGTDEQYALIPQSEALGHIPATFRRLGDVL